MKKGIRFVLINLLVLSFLVEVTSFLFIKIKQPIIEGYAEIPGFLDFNFKTRYEEFIDPVSPKCIDTLYPWCTWHPRNRIHHQVTECYDVVYRFNELGARGILPDPNDTATIFFLGDSFAEGFGLQEDSTVAERVSRASGRRGLNLGTSGDFGSTQMSLVYEEFAKLFQHRDVFVLLYPANDFTDNNPELHPQGRYRPYRFPAGKDSSVIRYKGSPDSTNFSWKVFRESVSKQSEKVKTYGFFSYLFLDYNPLRILDRFTQLSYSRRTLKFLFAQVSRRLNEDPPLPGELNYSDTDLEILEQDIRSIAGTAEISGARVHFVNLPSRFLLEHIQDKGDAEYKELERKMSVLAQKYNAEFLSFYDYLLNRKIESDDLFFSCDIHYSDRGARALADFITGYLRKK